MIKEPCHIVHMKRTLIYPHATIVLFLYLNYFNEYCSSAAPHVMMNQRPLWKPKDI